MKRRDNFLTHRSNRRPIVSKCAANHSKTRSHAAYGPTTPGNIAIEFAFIQGCSLAAPFQHDSCPLPDRAQIIGEHASGYG